MTYLIVVLILALCFVTNMLFKYRKLYKNETALKERFMSYYTFTNKWLRYKNYNKRIADYLAEDEIKSLGIYGFGELGKRLYEDLKKGDIKISCLIDNSLTEPQYNIPLLRLHNNQPLPDIKMDAIIVTPIYDFKNIERRLRDAGFEGAILSLEDIIY